MEPYSEDRTTTVVTVVRPVDAYIGKSNIVSELFNDVRVATTL